MVTVGVAGAFALGVWYGVSLERSRQPWARERLLSAALDSVRVNFLDSLPEEEVMRRAVSGMLRELKDPYAALLEGEGLTEYRGTLRGESQGVGLLLRLRQGDVLVRRVARASPAALAGLQPGDVVESVDGQRAIDAWSALRPQTGSASRKARPSDSLRLTVRRAGVDRPLDVLVVRSSWRLSSVPRAFLAADGVGYVHLANSASGSTDSLANAVERLLDGGARSLVLDLRGNMGGLYDEGVRTAALFLNRGDVVASLDGRGARSRDVQRARETRWPTLPMVLLVDRFTASSAELIAAALRDHGRALLVGDRTFGKGVVQRVVHISPELSLRLTTARWVPPSGAPVEPRDELRGVATGGLAPDVYLPPATPLDMAAVSATLSPVHARTLSDLVDHSIASIERTIDTTIDTTIDPLIDTTLSADVAAPPSRPLAEQSIPELEVALRAALTRGVQSIRGTSQQRSALVGDGTRVAVRRVLEASARDTTLWRYAANDDAALLAALDVLAPGLSSPVLEGVTVPVAAPSRPSRSEARELARIVEQATANGEPLRALEEWTGVRFASREQLRWDSTTTAAGTTRPGPRIQGTVRAGHRDTLVAVHFAAGAFAPTYTVGDQVALADPSGSHTGLTAVVVDRFPFRAPTVPRLPGASYARNREWRVGWAYLVVLPQRVASAHTHGFGGWRLLDVQ